MQPGLSSADSESGVCGSGVARRCDGKGDLTAGRDLDVALLRGDEDAGVLAGDAAVKIDVLHDSDLIDLEGSVVPAARDLDRFLGPVSYETVRCVDADDGGFDGDRLPVLEDQTRSRTAGTTEPSRSIRSES